MADPLLDAKIANVKAQLQNFELNSFLDALVVEDAAVEIDDVNAYETLKAEANNARARMNLFARRIEVRKASLAQLEAQKTAEDLAAAEKAKE
jgi:hypothetical protein